MSSFAARPTAEDVAGRCGGWGRQDTVETPPCCWVALEYPELANAGWRVKDWGAVGGGFDMERQELFPNPVR